MITYYDKDTILRGTTRKKLIQIACLKTDTKPTANVATGSLALEVDTGDVYAFDETSSTWSKINS